MTPRGPPWPRDAAQLPSIVLLAALWSISAIDAGGHPSQIDTFPDGLTVSAAVEGPWPRPPLSPRPLLHRGASRNEHVRLDHNDLKYIYSVTCLKAKQHDPNYPCTGFDVVPDRVLKAMENHYHYENAPLGVGNFPNFWDERCRSGGELFCDPAGIMKDNERAAIKTRLKQFRITTKVMCGGLDKVLTGWNVVHKHKFVLATIVANDWPTSESDAQSLQKFGLYILSKWNLLNFFNGVDARDPEKPIEPSCPTSALLIVFPDRGQAFLSAPSCEFICSERGGPQVVASVEGALRQGASPAQALLVGIEAVERVVNSISESPLSMAEPSTMRDRRHSKDVLKWEEQMMKLDTSWIFLQRAALLGLCAGFVVFVVAFVYYNCQPTPPTLRKN